MVSIRNIDSTDRRARQHFFIPIDEAVFFSNLDQAIERSDSLFRDIAKSFRRNLEAVILTVAVPFHLTVAASQRFRFHQLFIAERIRAQTLLDDGKSKEQADESALAIARERFLVEQQLPEHITQMSTHVLESLEKNLDEEQFARASSELLRQGTVSVWGAFEVLVQDMISTLLNAKPDVAVGVLTHERTKGLYQLKALPLDILTAHNFDVSGSLGDILVRHRAVDNVPVMKAVFTVLLPEGDKLKELLDLKELWILNQRRHLLVHRRGIVDADYLRRTGDALALGAELTITPNDLEQCLTVVVQTGVELISETLRYHQER